MDDKTAKEIEKKNLIDILEENLRIINTKIPEKEEPIPKEELPFISDDDANLEQIELKSLDYGHKILKPIRKFLHREIRDWIINPIQLKQTKFNLKQKEFNQKLEEKIEEKHSALEEKHSALETHFNELLSLENNIKKCYLKILERPADENGIRYYSNKLENGEIELKNLEDELKNSKEYSILESKKHIYEKYRSKIEKPIFIIGVPRSGTTIVQHIFSVHPELVWMSQNEIDGWLTSTEKHQIISYYQWLKNNNKKIPTSDEALYVLGRDLGPGFKNFPNMPKSSEIPIEGEHFWRKNFGGEYVEDIPLDKKILVVKEISNLIERKQKHRFVNKAPQNSMRLFALYKIFPDAKFINLVRDPRAVISSMMKRREDEGEFLNGFPHPNEFEFDELTDVEKFAYRYEQILTYIYDFGKLLDEKNFLTVFYEDLVDDPTQNIKKMLDFCELETSEDFETQIPKISSDKNKKWHDNLTNADQKTISQMLKSILEKTMYPYDLQKEI